MLKQVIAATNNTGKLKEFQEILSPLGFSVISMREAGISADPEENGTIITLCDIAGVPICCKKVMGASVL